MNAARCKDCGEILVSTHVHDLQSCMCGNYIDGGNEYTRVGIVPHSKGLDLLSESEFKALIKELGWANKGNI